MTKQTIIGSFGITSLVVASYVCASPVSSIDAMLEAVKARNEKSFLQTKSAIERAEKPASGDAEKAKSLFEQAMAAYKSQDFLTAVDLLTKAGSADPAHGRAATYLGMAQLKTNNAVAAELALRRAIALEPNNSQAWMYLADALAIQGRTDQAASGYYLAWYFSQNQQTAVQYISKLASSSNRSIAAAAQQALSAHIKTATPEQSTVRAPSVPGTTTRKSYEVTLLPTGRSCDVTKSPSSVNTMCSQGREVYRANQITYEFNDAMYRAVLSWIPEDEFSVSGNGAPIAPASNSDAKVFKVEVTESGLQAKRQAEIDRKEQAKLEAKKKLEADILAKRQEEEAKQAAIKKEQENQHQQHAERKAHAMRSSKVQPLNALVWIDNEDARSAQMISARTSVSASECFGWVNYFYQRSIEGNNTFHAPPKSEFEKSSDYANRVGQEKARFEETKTQRAEEARKKLESLLISQLGSPFISNVKYNADTEEFQLTVSPEKCSFDLPIKIKAPVKEAPQLKTTLEQMRPVVVYEFAGDTMAAKYIELLNNNKIAYTSSFNVTAPLKFNAENAAKFKVIAEKLQKDSEIAAATAERERLNRMRSTQWGRYYLAINARSHVCDNFRTIIMNFHNQGVPENNLNSIARDTFVSAERAGCVN